ncbi:phosphatidate phosphatase LPIN1 isoform X2 [Denticeps clupeoides]|uniref:phosphatidate phosphatase LPIN1 isoform X2 n=1 Tax=Denticeps clupeoides TaxID=299321 RepID=UPI0010A41CED|nr:phosphatidate phosphatase LPIN1-like isoform X2 [Denticeps clupeoides]
MNYVGQLAGQVFVQVKELYRGLNPATLSGCIDVIVVRQPDGSLQCSPFHVRFGKMGVLRSREKVVDIEINGEAVSLHMKLGENGEAFFVKEAENDQADVPPYLATSPIMSEGSALMESQLGKSSLSAGDSTLAKKRRKRRRKSQIDLKRQDNDEYSENEDMFTIDLSSDEEMEESCRDSPCDFHENVVKGSSSNTTFVQRTGYPHPAENWARTKSTLMEQTCTLPIPAGSGLSISCPPETSVFLSTHSPNISLPSTPKSDSELLNSQMDKGKADNPEMLWAWGELPHAAKPAFAHQKPDPVTVAPVSIPVSESTHFRAIVGDYVSEAQDNCPAHTSTYSPELREAQAGATAAPSLDVEAIGAVARLLTDLEDGRQSPSSCSRPISKTDSPSKRRDKRSHHLGSDGIYLDDITELEPEVAALYFPKSEGAGSVKTCQEVRSANQSPQSVGSSGMDSGVDSYSDQTRDMPSIAISLCGGLTDSMEITSEQFQEKAISYEEFAENPSIIDDPNLVVRIGTKYYNWPTAAPLMLAMQVFQKPLPKAAVENVMKEKMPKKGGRWWFSWRGRGNSAKMESASEKGAEESGSINPGPRMKDDSSSEEEGRAARLSSVPIKPDPVPTPAIVCYQKTLRLTSEQLAHLQLQDGPNSVIFSVTTQYQGTCRCEGTIYLWNWDDKIVISDIDGTITRSDTLGHILPTLGKDWTHQGIARLYHKVSQNGYKFMYCSARAIGMADLTRGYLNWVNERGTMLPQGPVLLSPSSLFSAFHREVIEKKPEKFKIECLTDIKQLFYPNTEPFYAAFGNRPTDVYSYKEVGVPLNRIFTVNPKGELIQEHAKTNISSYGRLCEVVDHVFPLMVRGNTSDFPCSDYSTFTYWRDQIPEVDGQADTPIDTS